MKKYTLEVTEEQLLLISDACELSSRLRSGQFSEISNFFNDIIPGIAFKTGVPVNRDTVDRLLDQLKKEVGLEPNASLGIHGSSDTAKALYEIYYLIKHHFAVKQGGNVNVYRSPLLEMTKKPKIKIKPLD